MIYKNQEFISKAGYLGSLTGAFIGWVLFLTIFLALPETPADLSLLRVLTGSTILSILTISLLAIADLLTIYPLIGESKKY